jgi:hypothetical protein
MTDLDITNRGSSDAAPQDSAALGVFLALASAQDVSFRVVELAGRGITADTAAVHRTVEVGQTTTSDTVPADRLRALGALEDELVRLWHSFRSGTMPLAILETGLEQIVIDLETWPSSLTGLLDEHPADVSWDMP